MPKFISCQYQSSYSNGIPDFYQFDSKLFPSLAYPKILMMNVLSGFHQYLDTFGLTQMFNENSEISFLYLNTCTVATGIRPICKVQQLFSRGKAHFYIFPSKHSIFPIFFPRHITAYVYNWWLQICPFNA